MFSNMKMRLAFVYNSAYTGGLKHKGFWVMVRHPIISSCKVAHTLTILFSLHHYPEALRLSTASTGFILVIVMMSVSSAIAAIFRLSFRRNLSISSDLSSCSLDLIRTLSWSNITMSQKIKRSRLVTVSSALYELHSMPLVLVTVRARLSFLHDTIRSRQ